jgi:antitoxin (DNA-binding transcriptional repressor) of toxin-antitoxin stability system
MAMTASALRANIYQVLDEVLRTGQPVDIQRGGRLLQIVPVDPSSRLENLTPHPDFVIGDPEALAEVDWADLWQPPEL